MTTINNDSNPNHVQWATQIKATDTNVHSEEVEAWINELQRVLDEMTQPVPAWAGSPQEAQLMAASYIIADMKAQGTLGNVGSLAGKVGTWRNQFETLRNQLLGVDKSELPVALKDLNEVGLTQALHGWIVHTVAIDQGHLPRTLNEFLDPKQTPSPRVAMRTSAATSGGSSALNDFSQWASDLDLSAKTLGFIGILVKKNPSQFKEFQSTLNTLGSVYSDSKKGNRVMGKLLTAIAESDPAVASLEEATGWLNKIVEAVKDKSDVTLNGTQLELVIDGVLATNNKNTKQEFESILNIVQKINGFPEEHEALLAGVLLEVEQTLGSSARDALIQKYQGKEGGAIALAQDAIKQLVDASPDKPSWSSMLSKEQFNDVIKVQVSKLIVQSETGNDVSMSLVDVKNRLLMPAKDFIDYVFNVSGFQSPLIDLVGKWRGDVQDKLAAQLAQIWNIPSMKEALTLAILSLFVLEDMKHIQASQEEQTRQEMKLLQYLEQLDIKKMSQKDIEEALALFEHVVEDPDGIVQSRLILADAAQLEAGFDKIALVLRIFDDISQGQADKEGKRSEDSPAQIILRLFGSVRSLSKSNAQAVVQLMDFGGIFDSKNEEHWTLLGEVSRLVGEGALAEAKKQVDSVYSDSE